MSGLSLEMLRAANRPLVTPVIHVADADQAVRNIDKAVAAGCPGVFLINHDFPMEPFLPVLRALRTARPDVWVGVDFLAQRGSVAFPVLAELAAEGFPFQAYWADDGQIDERSDEQPVAEEIARIRKESRWDGLYFAGVAFKKQRPVDPADFAIAAEKAKPYVDVITTSGRATGEAAELSKIETFRAVLGETPLAVASGINAENAPAFAPLVDCVMVATGINYVCDFYEIDPDRLAALMAVMREPAQ